MSEGVSEVSEPVSAAEGASKASSLEQANEWAVRANERTDGPVLQSVFLAVMDQNALAGPSIRRRYGRSVNPTIYHFVTQLTRNLWVKRKKDLTFLQLLEQKLCVRSKLSLNLLFNLS